MITKDNHQDNIKANIIIIITFISINKTAYTKALINTLAVHLHHDQNISI